MDVGPREESTCGDVDQGGIVVLRSFGKFFGLAGVRLGFAVTSPDVAERIDGEFGPWSVSGPALEYGLRALRDLDWQDAMRERLSSDVAKLDRTARWLRRDGRWRDKPLSSCDQPGSRPSIRYLGSGSIIVRNVADRPQALRFGLPGNETERAPSRTCACDLARR